MRKLFTLTLALLASFSLCWAANDVYYVMLYNSITEAGVLTSNSSLSNGIVKYTSSTGKYASSTDITVTGMGTAKSSKYNNSNISNFTTAGNWAAGSGTAYAAGGKFTSLTIALGAKHASSIKFIGYRNSSSTGEMTIGETKKTTAKKPSTYGNDCLLEWTGDFTGNINVSITDDKEHVGVFVITVPATKYSVTYKAGEGTGSDVVDSDAKTVKTFATCGFTAPSGYEFKEWQDGSSNVVEEGATVSSDMTLTAIYRLIPTKYTVRYSLNGASGDAPTETDKAAGDAFNLAAAPERDGYRFDGWLCNIDSEVKAAGSSYTMTAAATTFTAQWTQLFTVAYYDGATKLGEESVANGGHPTKAETYETRALASFVNWYSNADLADGNVIASVAALTISANTNIYGKWNKAYASDIDFVDFIDSEGSNWQQELTNHNFAISNTADVTLDNNSKEYDKGLKIKHSGTTLSFRVAAGKVVAFKTGSISGATLSVNGGEAENLTLAATTKTRYYYSAEEQMFVMTMTTNSYNIFKSVTILDPLTVTYVVEGGEAISPVTYTGTPITLPTAVKGEENFIGWFDAADGGTIVGEAGASFTPSSDTTLYAQFEAISTDARLSAITFSSNAGTLSPAFNPEVTSYTYTMPYGSEIPTITGATAYNVKAQEPEIAQQAAAWGENAIVRGVAESGDKKTYTITMARGPKDGICLVWADVTAANTISVNETKSKVYTADDVTLNISDVSGQDKGAPSNGQKFQTNGRIGIALKNGTFKTNDIVALNVTYISSEKTMYVYKSTDAEESDKIGSSTGNTVAGINTVAITEDAASIWLARTSDGWNPNVNYVAVYRIVMPTLDSIKFNGIKATVDQDLKTASVILPKNTVVADVTVTPYITRNAPHATTPEAVITNSGTWIEGTNTYRIMDKDGDYTDYVITIAATGTALDNTADEIKAVKFVENGQLFIRRGEKVYTITGEEVK